MEATAVGERTRGERAHWPLEPFRQTGRRRSQLGPPVAHFRPRVPAVILPAGGSLGAAGPLCALWNTARGARAPIRSAGAGCSAAAGTRANRADNASGRYPKHIHSGSNGARCMLLLCNAHVVQLFHTRTVPGHGISYIQHTVCISHVALSQESLYDGTKEAERLKWLDELNRQREDRVAEKARKRASDAAADAQFSNTGYLLGDNTLQPQAQAQAIGTLDFAS